MAGDGRSIRFPPDLLRQIERMAELNIYGGSPSEIVRRFVYEGMERVAREGIVENALRDRELLAQEKRDTIKALNTKSGS